MIMPYLDGEPADVTFKAHGRAVELTVDSETGLTDLDIARLCAQL